MGNNTVKFQSQIDLVVAAQAEYDFLRLIDKHPVLYKSNVIYNAIYRYEKYWLPLVAEQGCRLLPAPLDVEWVWHCHILSPFQYREDCIKIVGKVVDHQPYKLCETKKPLSERYWKEKYPNVPFDIDLNDATPFLIEKNYEQKSAYDIASATLRQRSFNYATSLPHYRDEKFLREAVSRYYVMLQIKRDNPSMYIVPCYDNDLIWHSHQQHPLAYHEDTFLMLGRMLDHNDTTNDRSPGSRLEEGSADTKKLWKKRGRSFGVPGAMYRGEPSEQQTEPNYSNHFRFSDLADKVSPTLF